MDNKELIKLAYGMGAHPYSVGGMVAALQKGIEIGKEEQKAIDIDRIPQLLDEWWMSDGNEPSDEFLLRKLED